MSVHIAERDVITITGSDAREYLQGQLSQDVDSLEVGESRWSLVLQPQGKLVAMFRITKTEDSTYLLDVDPGWGEALRERLQRFLLRVDVNLELESWDHHAYRNEVRPDVEAPIVAAVDWTEPGTDVVAPKLDEPIGVERLSDDDMERLRILSGIPAMGAELGDDTIPAEAPIVESTVSFTKGCYTGQELVARIDSRGSNTPRSLHRASGALPAPSPDAEFTVDGKVAGRLTSVAVDGDRWIGLAYLKRAFDAPLTATLTDADVRIEKLDR